MNEPNKRKELSIVAKKLCRELRVNQTQSEKILWDKIRNRQLLGKKFLRQHPIFYDLKGRETFYTADFYYHKLKLVAEIDGEVHRFRRKNDNERDYVMNMLGLKVIRIKNEMVIKDLDSAIRLIKEHIIE